MTKFKEYKLIANFNKWRKHNNPDKLYCITTEEGEELFDVYEDDFITMIDKGIVNSEGNYYLLNNPTKEQIQQYAKEYGILWVEYKKELIKDINYLLDLMCVVKYSCTGLNIKVNDELYITAISRTRITFKNNNQIYDLNLSSKEVTKEILQLAIHGLLQQ